MMDMIIGAWRSAVAVARWVGRGIVSFVLALTNLDTGAKHECPKSSV